MSVVPEGLRRVDLPWLQQRIIKGRAVISRDGVDYRVDVEAKVVAIRRKGDRRWLPLMVSGAEWRTRCPECGRRVWHLYFVAGPVPQCRTCIPRRKGESVEPERIAVRAGDWAGLLKCDPVRVRMALEMEGLAEPMLVARKVRRPGWGDARRAVQVHAALLIADGLDSFTISKALGIPSSTIRYWKMSILAGKWGRL